MRWNAGILTLIKNSFKRYVGEEFIHFAQDICFISKRRIFIPDLYNIFPISNANTDANDLVIYSKDKKRLKAKKFANTQS